MSRPTFRKEKSRERMGAALLTNFEKGVLRLSGQVHALRFGRNNLSAVRGECQGK